MVSPQLPLTIRGRHPSTRSVLDEVLRAAVSMCDREFGSGKAKKLSMGGRCRGSWYEWFLQPCLVELLGSALFIFIGCLSVIENGTDTGLLQPALAHGLALGLLIATLGNISGGHFNPAVSLAATLIGGLNLVMLLPYWISQLCGGLIGAALAKGQDDPLRLISCEAHAGFGIRVPSSLPRGLTGAPAVGSSGRKCFQSLLSKSFLYSFSQRVSSSYLSFGPICLQLLLGDPILQMCKRKLREVQ
ncbi:aquaporin-8 isoform X3 [Lutra lutra]|uniref:aquaporin-8 isoform X3 n=1 Tax=Lutra lutra TaxID=9657 RepID=UPI001FD10C87|nr:aquaporin-8 isoform X3 [Lutra lutra]